MFIEPREGPRSDPMAAFTYALKASESKRQYPRRFKIFLDYLNLKGTLVEQAEQFYLKASKDPLWCEQNLMAFVEYEKGRATETNDIHTTTSMAVLNKFMCICKSDHIVKHIINCKEIKTR